MGGDAPSSSGLPYVPSRNQSMPLLVGLLDSSHSRGSDYPLRSSHDLNEEHYDLEELAAKRLAGGGMIDSIANMANSILGAGIIGKTR